MVPSRCCPGRAADGSGSTSPQLPRRSTVSSPHAQRIGGWLQELHPARGDDAVGIEVAGAGVEHLQAARIDQGVAEGRQQALAGGPGETEDAVTRVPLAMTRSNSSISTGLTRW